jgi:diacylglycerol kinase (ATP)
VLDRAGRPYEVRISENPAHPEELAREAVAAGVPVVAVMGGDGTIGMVAHALAGSATILGVIPAGTGDDFARALRAERRDPVAAARVVVSGVVRNVDAGVVRCEDAEERWFVNVANAGFDAAVSETANGMRFRGNGTLTYILALISTLRRFRPARFTITMDDEPPRELGAMLIAVGNGSSYGGGMKVTPGASIDDGEFEACVVHAMGKLEFISQFPKVYRGTHAAHPKVTMLHGARLQVSADAPAPVYADGERVGHLPATFEVRPGSLRVLVAPV